MRKIGFSIVVLIMLFGMVACSPKVLEYNQVKIDTIVVTLGVTTIGDFVDNGFDVAIRQPTMRVQKYELDTAINPKDNYIDLYLTKGSYAVNVMQFAHSETVREMTVGSFYWNARESKDNDFIRIGEFSVYANDDFEEIAKKIESLNPTDSGQTTLSAFFSFMENKYYHTIGKNLQGEFGSYQIKEIDFTQDEDEKS